ncbi:hypothetical protein DL89DRAFT_321907 [Linderina pennispora]|uniref:CAP-Gly domain-containing protein n=1 Tax=Linderina pennispora TaxID=61395 RepID=A0A1Y1WDW3_9FUNG|nr:uncharacterized protein DL89DRAFT_321907 [Linderina pennispora]ORX71642.1 hypothetical protein DL89DRAFT_321907 [Linderina pennispora]
MSVVTLFVQSQNASSERRFLKSLTVGELKVRLEAIVGISASDQRLALQHNDAAVCMLDDNSRMLGYYPVADYMTLNVEATNSVATQLNFNDDSQVEKYVMDDDEYDKRRDTVRAFKRRHNLGRFADNKSAMSIDEEDEFRAEASGIHVDDRCQVEVLGSGTRLGAVRFVGKTQFRPGYWVGVEFDEPTGKHDGTVDGVRYFECRNQHGSFVRPDKVTVGDFPEEDLFSDLEEM